MNRRTRITYLVLGLLIAAGLTYSEMNKPRPINWSDSFSRKHHIPFGSLIFYELMEARFGDRWHLSTEAPYDWLDRNDSLRQSVYFLINTSYSFDEYTRQSLLEWVAAGNRVLLSATYPDTGLMDTLGIGLDYKYSFFTEHDTIVRRLVNPGLGGMSELDQRGNDYYPIGVIDSLGLTGSVVLGMAEADIWERGEVDFARVPWGEGEFYIHLYPYAFTNYVMLSGNQREYTAGVMAYFNDARGIYWDEYLKAGGQGYRTDLYIFLSTREFRLAYYLAIAGALLYILFQGKRKQRAIPVVPPVENQSVNFTRTLGDMYLDGGHNAEIVAMKWEHFLEFIRTHLYISTEHLDEQFFKLLSARSNQSEEELKKLFTRFSTLRGRQTISQEMLIELDQQIHSFKEKCHGKR